MEIKFKSCLIFFIIICIHTLSNANMNINSEAGILVEVSTGRILYEKNSTKQMYPASTTKIMTAILTIENCKLDDIVIVNESAISNIPSGYVTCDLQAGEELTVKDLLYALMIPSANDAAYVLAEHVAGSVDAFSDMMNSKARELGCNNTHFINPNGIHNEKHYSTAYDLYLIANYCQKNDTFRKIVSSYEYALPTTNLHPNLDRHLTTTNELINPNSNNYYKNAIGIKTGFTSKAGKCIVAESSRDGLEFIAVVLNGGITDNGQDARFVDAKTMFDYAYDNFSLTKIAEKNQVIKSIEIENATKETKNLDLIIDNSITIVTNTDLDVNNVIPEITLSDNLEAPIHSGNIVGTVKYKVDDIEYSANLLAKSDVNKQDYTNIYLIIIAFVLLLIASILLKNQKKSSRKKRHR